jgi:hypothetical protein
MLALSMLPAAHPLQHPPRLLVAHRPQACRQAAVLQPQLPRPLLKQLLRARPLLLPQPPVSYAQQVQWLQECLEITSACVTSLANMHTVPLDHAYVPQQERQLLHLQRQVSMACRCLERTVAILAFVALLVVMVIVPILRARLHESLVESCGGCSYHREIKLFYEC